MFIVELESLLSYFLFWDCCIAIVRWLYFCNSKVKFDWLIVFLAILENALMSPVSAQCASYVIKVQVWLVLVTANGANTSASSIQGFGWNSLYTFEA